MILKSSDPIDRLFLLIGQGFVSSDDIIKMVDSRSIKMGEHLHWTFSQFWTLTQLKTDLERVNFLLSLKKEKVSLLSRFKRNRLTVGRYLDALKLIRDGIEDINTAMSKIEQPKMSGRMKAAGFGSLNFEDRGVARSVGAFEGIGTVAAYDLPMFFIINSLKDTAMIKICEKNHSDIMETENKAIK